MYICTIDTHDRACTFWFIRYICKIHCSHYGGVVESGKIFFDRCLLSLYWKPDSVIVWCSVTWVLHWGALYPFITLLCHFVGDWIQVVALGMYGTFLFWYFVNPWNMFLNFLILCFLFWSYCYCLFHFSWEHEPLHIGNIWFNCYQSIMVLPN